MTLPEASFLNAEAAWLDLARKSEDLLFQMSGR